MRCFAILALVSATMLGTSSALVDASRRTTVTVDANAYDERPSPEGCDPDGCVPEFTRDRDRTDNSRWSCSEDLAGENCEICFDFDEAQDIERLRIAFYLGDTRTRRLKVKTNGDKWGEIESSGETSGYESFDLGTDETEELCLESLGLGGDDFISITEVRILVE